MVGVGYRIEIHSKNMEVNLPDSAYLFEKRVDY
jgi:hypothetical protein